jgi:PAS domain S-box-containing protein
VRAFQTGRQGRDELMGIRRRDGSVVHVRSNATPIVSAGSDTPDRIVVTYVDITEQFAAERRAAEAAADMSSVFEVTADALVMVDESGTILRVNSATYDIFRYEEGELLGQNVSVLSPDPTRGEHARYMRHYLETGQASTEMGLVIGHSREMVGRRKDGSEFPVEFRVDEIRRDDGSRAFSAQIRDITERRQAERDRAQAQRSAVRADFLSTMSHELRTPLNSILGFGQLLEMQFAGPLNEKQLGQVQDIVGAGEQLLALINDLLDIWRIDAQRWAIEPAPLHPGAVIAETTRGFGDAAAAKGIDLRAVLNDAPAEATLDERALRQVVSNLVENAVKFTDDGRVEVRAIEQDGDLVVTVADSGCGIAEEDRERIFDEFTQVQSGLTREHEGTGLGLAIVRRLVEAHGGGVSVESALGEGSTFTVRLPLKPPAADARPAQAEVVAER